MLEFEWDSSKANANLKKHGVPFEEGASIFGDPLSLTIPDPQHSQQEQRFITVGVSAKARTLVVVHVERGDRVRIISARLATKGERKTYEEI